MPNRVIDSAIIGLACLLCATGCSNDDVVGPDPHVPFVPSDPVPFDGSDEIPLSMALQWSGLDPDGDELTYDVYFGDTRSPQLVATALGQEQYYVSSLERRKAYYWRVVAFDLEGNSTRSPLWRFETSPKAADYVFPLKLHNRWNYVTENRMTVSYADSSSPPMSNTIPGQATIEVSERDYSLAEVDECYRVNVALDSDGHTYQRVQLCGNEPSGLIVYENWGKHDFGLSPSLDDLIGDERLVRGERQKDSQGLALTYPSECVSLVYPLEVGSKWTTYQEPEGRWHNEKEVVGLVTRTVPAGTFECYEIRWHIHVDAEGKSSGSLEWTDYIAREGLVERIIRTESTESSQMIDHPRTMESVAQYRLREFDLR